MKIILDERYSISDWPCGGYAINDNLAQVKVNKVTGVKDYTELAILWPSTLVKAVERYLMLINASNEVRATFEEYIAEYTKQVDRIQGLMPEIKEKL